MPIAVTCSCGKKLSVRDELAGKAIKCPACQQVVRVGAATAAANPTAPRPAAAAPAAARPATGAPRPAGPPAAAAAAAAPPTTMDHLFEEAGLKVKVGQFCPACLASLPTGAVLCTKCGYHLETGARVQGHQSELLEEDSAESALRKAEQNMKRSKEMDERLQAAGMPPWMLAMILYLLASTTAVGVVAVNISRQKNASISFNAVATLLMLAGVAFNAVAMGSMCVVIYRAFKEDAKQGMFVLLIPLYVFYYAFTRFKKVGLPFLVSLVTTIIAVVLYVLANLSMTGRL